eukprot:Skav209312  [mRNA]  locus=scaffold994:454641:455288:+ [translate_table: standard]
MADGKLVSSLGYSLRLAQKQGRNLLAQHLSLGLYSLTQELSSEKVTMAKPLSLYSALGLGGSEPVENSQGLVAGQRCCDQFTQTEIEVMSMQQFEIIIAKIQTDLVEKLTPHLQSVRGTSQDTLDISDALLVHPSAGPSSTAAPSASGDASLLHSVDEASSGLDAAQPSSHASSSSVILAGPVQRQSTVRQQTREEQKRQRREHRRQELLFSLAQ